MQEIIRNFEYYKFHLEEQKNPIYIFHQYILYNILFTFENILYALVIYP